MGYESRLYIVEKTEQRNFNDRQWARVIATIELGKVYPFSDWFRKKKETRCFFYDTDGNTEIFEDHCGDILKEASLSATLSQLERVSKTDDYWRYKVAIDLIISILNASAGLTTDIVVLHFGH